MQVSGIPDPDGAADLAEFVRMLEQLRLSMGAPPLRDLAHRVGALLRPPRQVSKSTLADMFQPGRRRLNQDLVVAVVRALCPDEDVVRRWSAACVRVHAEAKTGGPAGVFSQLPADLATFTGRQEELARLITAATSRRDADSTGAKTVVVSAIEGMAGVGKTRLAVRAGAPAPDLRSARPPPRPRRHRRLRAASPTRATSTG